MGLLFISYLLFLSYSLQHSFSVLFASISNDNMPWRGSILVKSVWCPGGFLYLNGLLFLEIWRYRSCWVLEPLCVFRCSCAVVVEGACVGDCRGTGVCTIGTVG
jgi:hypothetical protein